MHAWAFGSGFSFNIDIDYNASRQDAHGTGRPFVIGACLRNGGGPESRDIIEVQELSKQKLYLNTVHYQGDSKQHIPYDICRVLMFSGDREIILPQVRDHCVAIIGRNQKILPCRNHEIVQLKSNVCV